MRSSSLRALPMTARRPRWRLASLCAAVVIGMLAPQAGAAPPAPSALASRRHADRSLSGRRLLPPATRAPLSVAAASEPIGEAHFNDCRRLPSGKRDVPVTLKPETDVDHLIFWISSITCQAFGWSASLGAERRKITVVAPAEMTPAQAFRLFVDALGSVGLTVEPWGRFFQIIDSVKAKSRPIPLYDWDGHPIAYTRSARERRAQRPANASAIAAVIGFGR